MSTLTLLCRFLNLRFHFDKRRVAVRNRLRFLAVFFFFSLRRHLRMIRRNRVRTFLDFRRRRRLFLSFLKSLATLRWDFLGSKRRIRSSRFVIPRCLRFHFPPSFLNLRFNRRICLYTLRRSLKRLWKGLRTRRIRFNILRIRANFRSSLRRCTTNLRIRLSFLVLRRGRPMMLAMFLILGSFGKRSFLKMLFSRAKTFLPRRRTAPNFLLNLR